MEHNGIAVEVEETTSDGRTRMEAHNAKTAKVLDACCWKDVVALRALGISDGGFLSDELRRQAWPILLGYDESSNEVKPDRDPKTRGLASGSWVSLPKHRDEDQVRLDVDRSFIWYPYGQTSAELTLRKQELSDLITQILRENPFLNYFQGYHDICQVFLLVLNPTSRVQAVSRLSTLRIRDFMMPTLAPALTQLRLIPSILRAVHPGLYHHLSQTQPFFALSPTLTMYAHDIQSYSAITRLFDALLSQSPVFSVYMFAQIVLQRSEELFDTPADEPEILHSILSKLPQPLDIEHLIQSTVTLFEAHPPESLKVWRTLPKYSVLKTSRSQDECIKQTMADGEALFKMQVKDLKWQETREKFALKLHRYQKPAGIVGVAVLIGLISVWLKKPGAADIWGLFWKHLGGGGHHQR